MGVDHGGGEILVAEQLLNGADVRAGVQQVGGEGVAKGMAGDAGAHAKTAHDVRHGVLDGGLVQMRVVLSTAPSARKEPEVLGAA